MKVEEREEKEEEEKRRRRRRRLPLSRVLFYCLVLVLVYNQKASQKDGNYVTKVDFVDG
jgi:hypothetical protein